MRVFLSLFTPNRPPPLRVKSVEELAPGFRPRWVKYRRIGLAFTMIYFVVFAFFAMPFAIHFEHPLLGTLFTLIAFVSAGVAFDPIKASALIGLLCRPFSRMAVKHAQFEDWMEFDLDWEDQGR